MDAKANCKSAGDVWSDRRRRAPNEIPSETGLAGSEDACRAKTAGVFAVFRGQRRSAVACRSGFLRREATNLLLGAFVAAIVCFHAPAADAANLRTRNFIVQAPSPQLARAVGEAAERYRSELAIYWTGAELPPWPSPCPIRVVAGPNLAAQGVTTYNPAPVRDFQMEVVGSAERILDSVLPHEVTHTVLASHFGRPLPRWADEGICTTVEHQSEKAKHEAKLREFLSSRRGIAMNRLFLLTEYPADVLPMYAQGYSVCRFLIDQKGPRAFIAFLEDYMRQPSWTANVQQHYGYDSLAELQEYWLKWVQAGSGDVSRFVKSDSDDSPATASLASLQSSPDSDGYRIAPATARLGQQQSLQGERARNGRSGSVSGSKTKEKSWYDRPTRRGSKQKKKGKANRSLNDPDKPVDQVATVPQAKQSQSSVDSNQGLSWAPPSVLSSGRYSASQPQAESSGSIRSGSYWR